MDRILIFTITITQQTPLNVRLIIFLMRGSSSLQVMWSAYFMSLER